MRSQARIGGIEQFDEILQTRLEGQPAKKSRGAASGRASSSTQRSRGARGGKRSVPLAGFEEQAERLAADREAYAASRRSAKTRGTLLFFD
jgi:hypothetical protein